MPLAPSSRIGDLGVGTIIAFGGFIVIVLCGVAANSLLARPGWLHLVTVPSFIVTLLYLFLARRKDPFLPPDAVSAGMTRSCVVLLFVYVVSCG